MLLAAPSSVLIQQYHRPLNIVFPGNDVVERDKDECHISERTGMVCHYPVDDGIIRHLSVLWVVYSSCELRPPEDGIISEKRKERYPPRYVSNNRPSVRFSGS
jgi:hypothetical protein